MTTGFKSKSFACAFFCAVLSWQAALAQQQPPQPAPHPEQSEQMSPQERNALEAKAALQAAREAAQDGPVVVSLGEQGTIAVPEGDSFIPKLEAARLMRAVGNNPSSNLFGLVWSKKKGDTWFATLTFAKTGYIKDGDAKDWNVAELLQTLKQNTERDNADRVARGFTPFDVIGWVERPDYDSINHRLVWSVNIRDKGAQASGKDNVNYNTYVLGREGYFSLNFVTEMQSIEAQKPVARNLLSAVSFVPGKAYADYNSLTDHAAEFGVGALVAGVAAKKLGLLAVIGVFLAKAGKLLLIPLIAGGAFMRKLFGRNKGPAR